MPPGDVDLSLIDSHAGDVGAADFIFVFGTRHWTPAEIAVELFRAELAPIVVVTGGAVRQPDLICEAHQHRALIEGAGVPPDAIVVEDRSVSTRENVVLAAPLVMDRVPRPTTAIAVVKWYHRRALLTLAAGFPSLRRIYAADYEPYDPFARRILGRSTWQDTCPRSVRRETEYMTNLIGTPEDVLARTGDGWVRIDT